MSERTTTGPGREPPPWRRRGTAPRGRRPSRAWVLAGLTVAALVPLGVGIGVGALAGRGFPPTVTVGAGSEAVKAAVVGSCRGEHCALGPSRKPPLARLPVLEVTEGQRVVVRFGASGAPVSVVADLPGRPPFALRAANPTGFLWRSAEGSFVVKLAVAWPRGDEVVAVRVLVRHAPGEPGRGGGPVKVSA